MHRIEPALRATEPGPMTTTSGHAYDGHRASGAAARVGDADRDRAAALLNDATGAGYLRLDELEERLDRILRARTRGELDTALADLPREWLRERSRAEAVAGARRLARAALRAHVTSYAVGMLLMVGIWLAVGVAAGAWYPWPVWPALGWGIGVLSHWRGTSACGATPRA